LLNHLISEHDVPLNGKRGKSHAGQLPLFDKFPAPLAKVAKLKAKMPKASPVAEDERREPTSSKRTKSQASPGYQSREVSTFFCAAVVQLIHRQNTAKRTSNRPSTNLKENRA
jgi:hypothetical protein